MNMLRLFLTQSRRTYFAVIQCTPLFQPPLSLLLATNGNQLRALGHSC